MSPQQLWLLAKDWLEIKAVNILAWKEEGSRVPLLVQGLLTPFLDEGRFTTDGFWEGESVSFKDL